MDQCLTNAAAFSCQSMDGMFSRDLPGRLRGCLVARYAMDVSPQHACFGLNWCNCVGQTDKQAIEFYAPSDNLNRLSGRVVL